MNQFCHSAILPYFHTSILPFCHSPILPFCHSIILPFHHSAILPFCHSSILPFCSPSPLRSQRLRVRSPASVGLRLHGWGGLGWPSPPLESASRYKGGGETLYLRHNHVSLTTLFIIIIIIIVMPSWHWSDEGTHLIRDTWVIAIPTLPLE